MLLQLQVQLLGIKGRKARGVDDIGVLSQGEQLHMAGGVPPPAQGLADLPHRQGKTGVQGVENAGLPHAGVAGEGAELSGQLPAQLVDPLAGDGADPQHPDGGAAVYPVQLLRRVQVALVQAQQHPAVLQGGNGADAVDEIRVRHRQGGGGDDHQLVDVGRRRAVEGVAAGLHRLHKALAAAQLPDLDPVPHQGRQPLPAELAPGPALQGLRPGVHIVKPAEGLFNASPDQNVISWATASVPLIYSLMVEVEPALPWKV